MTPQYFGKYKAIVRDIYDKEEERGRIKVECPAVLGKDLSNWCETCFPCAYDEGGEFHLPLIGETVWVEFEEGDANKPIWVGNWHGEKVTPIKIARNEENSPKAPPMNDYKKFHDKSRIIIWKKCVIVLHEDYMRVYLGDEGDTEFFTNFDECYLERQKGTMKFFSNDDETFLERTKGKMKLYTNDDKTHLVRDDSELVMVDSDTQLFKAGSNIKLEKDKITVTTENFQFDVAKDFILNAKDMTTTLTGGLTETIKDNVTRTISNGNSSLTASLGNITETATLGNVTNQAPNGSVSDKDKSATHH